MPAPNKKDEYSRLEKEYMKKDDKKRKKMKVSGAGVKKLNRLIKNK